jgi:tetratricopeptide (TPR) repeat protein
LREKAIGYRLKGGQQAIARSAMMEAEAHLRKGLELVSSVPVTPKLQQYELDLQIALGTTLMTTQGFAAPTVAQTLASARQLCEHLDRPSELTMVRYCQILGHIIRSELELARHESDEFLRFAETRNDPSLRMLSYQMSAMAWFFLGNFTAARAYAEQAVTLYDPTHPHVWLTPLAIDPHSIIFLFRSCFYLGHFDQARLRQSEALEQARGRGDAHTLATLLGIALITEAHIKSDPELLLQRADQLEGHCAEHGFPFWSAYASLVRGRSLSALGRKEQALQVLRDALTRYRATGAVTIVPLFLISLAEASGKAGQPIEGLNQLDEAARQIEATQEGWTEPEMHCVRGELLIAVGDYGAAEASFQHALAVAHRQNANFWELLAALSLASFWRDQGKRNEARDLLAPVYNWFTEGLDTPILKEAKALLEQLTP